jgi:hypothetical protein
MKKVILTISVLLLGSRFAFASKGYASDGLMFILAVVAFLGVIVMILFLADYLRGNFRRLMRIAVFRSYRLWLRLRELFSREHRVVSA